MALDFLEFMTQRNIVGIFQKGENNFLLIFRNVEGSLKLAYLLTTVIGEKMRTMEIPQRISYDSKKNPQSYKVPKVRVGEKDRMETKDEEKAKETKEVKERHVAAAPVNWAL